MIGVSLLLLSIVPYSSVTGFVHSASRNQPLNSMFSFAVGVEPMAASFPETVSMDAERVPPSGGTATYSITYSVGT